MYRSRPRAYADPDEHSDASRSSRSRSATEEEAYTPQQRGEKRRRTSRSRSLSPPSQRHSRRERRERSESRSRSRSRSTTPERYERQLRRMMAERGLDYGRGRGGYHHHYHQHRHQEVHYGPHLPGAEEARGGYQGYGRGGFVHPRIAAFEDGRDNPTPSKCLGVFGMPSHVCEQDMHNMFEPFGKVEKVHVVINRDTGECRGYGFVYFESVEVAKRAREEMRDAKIDGIGIRVDFSVSHGPRRSYRD